MAEAKFSFGQPKVNPMEKYRKKSRCMVTIGMCKYKNHDRLRPTQDLEAVVLNGINWIINLGRVGPGVSMSGLKLCTVDDNTVVIAGLGRNDDEIWKCVMEDSKTPKSEKLGCMVSGRRHHGLVYHKGLVYVVGGEMRDAPQKENTIEIWNIANPKSELLSCLKYSKIQNSNGFLCNTVCCIHDDNLLIYGPYDYIDSYKHTLQVYNIKDKAITHSMVVPRDSDTEAFCVLPVGSNILLIARDYTAVCRWTNIQTSKPEKIQFLDNYIVPNKWCTVIMSEDGQNVMLYGGNPKEGKVSHYVYAASINSILLNDPQGWQKVKEPWPNGRCSIYSHAIMKLPELL